MYKRFLEQIITHRPEDPIVFLIDLLKRDNDDVPQIMLMGPPASGKRSIAKMICGKLRTAHLNMENLIAEADADLRSEAENYGTHGQAIPTDVWVRILAERVKLFDCVKKGWVMEGFPQTREQAQAMQTVGIFPKHCVILDAPDRVLIERAAGKRVDPKTGDVYHNTFEWPSDPAVQKRLTQVPGNSEEDVVGKLVMYHRHIAGIVQCYKACTTKINADQPKADVFSQAFSYLCSHPRSTAPHTPRVVLLGPTGSGKGVQASLLASRYNIVKVSCGQLIKQAIADETSAGQAAKAYIAKSMMVPDNIVLSILQDRLSQLDCVSQGWVLHGYPRTREQAEQLTKASFVPNRVFFLDVPNDSVLERLTQRAVDPITGDHYHMLYNPPRTQEIKDRLQQYSGDSDVEVKKRLTQYNVYVDEICEYYVDGQHVNADQDPHTVFETLESMIVNPIPKRYL